MSEAVDLELGRRLQLAAKPGARSDGLHRIGEQVSHSLMDVMARRALERLDVEANRAGGNPCQHSCRFARGAEWSLVHDASPLVQAGALQNSQSPVDTEGDGDSGSMEPFRVLPLVKIAHFREVEHSFDVAVLRVTCPSVSLLSIVRPEIPPALASPQIARPCPTDIRLRSS